MDPIRIFIDQGHNPQNPNAGAEGNGLREQDLTYVIGEKLAALLRADDRFDVALSRNSPEEVLGTSNASSLAARVNAAKEFGADYFLSLHLNASENPSANGSEAFVYALGGTSEDYAQALLTALTEQTGFRDLGVKSRPSLYVLRRTPMPAVLLEVGFISNPTEAAYIRDNTDSIARSLYNGTLSYFGFT